MINDKWGTYAPSKCAKPNKVCGDPDSGPRLFMAGTLLTESSPQPLKRGLVEQTIRGRREGAGVMVLLHELQS